MQGNFTIGCAGKKADIVKIEDAYRKYMDDSDGYIDTEKTTGFEQLPDSAPAQIMFRTNTSINVFVVDGLFQQLVESVPAVEAGCWWASLDTYSYFRTCLYSKAGSKKYEEFEDTICDIGDKATIYLCNRYADIDEEDPEIQRLLELYHKVPFDAHCKRVEPGSDAWKDWDYDKLPRTFQCWGKTYHFDDGVVEEVSPEDDYNFEGKGEDACYYDEDQDSFYFLMDFEDGIVRRWTCGKSEKHWIPNNKMKTISTINGVCYYEYS